MMKLEVLLIQDLILQTIIGLNILNIWSKWVHQHDGENNIVYILGQIPFFGMYLILRIITPEARSLQQPALLKQQQQEEQQQRKLKEEEEEEELEEESILADKNIINDLPVHEVLLSPKTRELLLQVRNEIKKLDSSTQRNLIWLQNLDDIAISRFIIGHQYKLAEIMTFLKNSAKWREEFQTDLLCVQWPLNLSNEARLLRDKWPFGSIGTHEGKAVMLYRFAMVDFPGYFKHCSLENIMRHTVWRIEQNIKESPEGNCILIMDLWLSKGFDKNPVIKSLWDVKPFISALMKYLHPLVKVADPNYPETFNKIIFVRAPGPFWGIWKVISPLLNENTRNKVIIYTNSDAKNDLLKHLPISCIPDCLGGEASTAHIPKGGKLGDHPFSEYNQTETIQNPLDG